ncbi:MAG: tetratricopeptide repeat protein [Bacteroidetes bacterium]|nr:tetratricopeptide repeat protein [Bacteroidota bacterium]
MRYTLFILLIGFIFSGCSKPSAEEMYKKGEDAQRAEQYDNALAAYQELTAAYPDSTRTPEAWYAIGIIYQNHKQSYHQAIQAYRHLVEKYPGHATSSSASFLIGFIYNNELKNVDSARIAYEDFLKRYPDNQLADDAKFELSNLGKSAGEILEEHGKTDQTKPVAAKGKK